MMVELIEMKHINTSNQTSFTPHERLATKVTPFPCLFFPMCSKLIHGKPEAAFSVSAASVCLAILTGAVMEPQGWKRGRAFVVLIAAQV